jgi:PHD/YefM family antitoxin component YafN of YafNO toxin-antitoxin module
MVSKSRFKAKALEYFRLVEETKQPLVITDRGRPVLKLEPFEEETPEEAFAGLRGSVVRYEDPMEPVGQEDWEVLR